MVVVRAETRGGAGETALDRYGLRPSLLSQSSKPDNPTDRFRTCSRRILVANMTVRRRMFEHLGAWRGPQDSNVCTGQNACVWRVFSKSVHGLCAYGRMQEGREVCEAGTAGQAECEHMKAFLAMSQVLLQAAS
jgi:hypothetical protein